MNVPSVSSVINQIKHQLESSFRTVEVIGEVSNLSQSATGHYYFSLSDKEGSLSCALFRGDALRNPLIKSLRNGQKIICTGPISVYSKRGTFQLLVKRMFEAGTGDLAEQLEKLKKKLAGEGLFDLDKKQPIPMFPKRIAVITAEHGAALRDFINIYERRSPWMDIVLVPALVQGDSAPQSIRKALFKSIKYHLSAESDKKFDVIVLTRGGGSLEDLWAFNDEGLVWDIYQCPIPVISAVGHQVDYTLSDYVADRRAETPSAAAEMLTDGAHGIVQSLLRLRRRLEQTSDRQLDQCRFELAKHHPKNVLSLIRQKLQFAERRINSCSRILRPKEFLAITEKKFRLDDLTNRMVTHVNRVAERERAQVEQAGNVLNALNPNNVLGRGYSYLKSGERVLASHAEFDTLGSGAEINVHFKDGVGRVFKSD